MTVAMRRLYLLAILPLLAMDCLACLCIGGSWRNTLSGEAWHQREHKHWGRTHRAIDWLFFWQTNHCQGQALREAAYGSVWGAWSSSWRSL